MVAILVVNLPLCPSPCSCTGAGDPKPSLSPSSGNFEENFQTEAGNQSLEDDRVLILETKIT